MLLLVDFLENINIFRTRVYNHELHVCHSMLLARLDCNNPLGCGSKTPLWEIARFFGRLTLKSGLNQIAERPNSFIFFRKSSSCSSQIQHGSSASLTVLVPTV